jgi:CBS domain-containing protein
MRRDERVTAVMTESVVVIEADRPVSEALECLEHYGIGHLPVMRDGRLVGILSSADAAKLTHFLPKGVPGNRRFLDERFRLEQFMSTPVVSVRSDATVGDAAEVLVKESVHAVPVVDDAGHVVGIVSTTDLIRACLNGAPRRARPPGPVRGSALPVDAVPDTTGDFPAIQQKPTDAQFATAYAAGQKMQLNERDPRHLAAALLYLAQRRAYLERVLTLADRFLLAGQDERTHSLLLKAIMAAKRAEELASGTAEAQFPPG